MTNPTLRDSNVVAEAAEQIVSTELDAINIEATNLITSFKTIYSATIRQSNRYYDKFSATYTVENLVWSSEHILDTYDTELRNKVRE